MNKKEPGETEEIMVDGHKLKVTVGGPGDKLASQKRIDKLNAMKIALTYTERHGVRKMTPEKAMEIADKFLAWLEK